jgi:hypothetical protein
MNENYKENSVKRKHCYPRKNWVMSAVLASTLFISTAFAGSGPWSFAIMSDTQWPTSPDGKNPNVAVNVINHLNEQFIQHGVKFVVQVGDLTDTGGTNSVNLDVRATFSQALYNSGIGFYPLRGNHESTGSNAFRFQQIFPQTGAVPANAGKNNKTPASAMRTTTYYGAPPAIVGGEFTMGSNFNSEPTMEGLTYSFDYNNARFILLDQFTKPSGTSKSNLDQTDVDWVKDRLCFTGDMNTKGQPCERLANTHAFNFAHKGLITENHADNLFGSNPTTSQASKDLMENYMKHLQTYGVRYHICGHDHMHNRAIVSSPNTQSYKVQNIIVASNSYKFYIPPTQVTFNEQAFRSLEKQIAQEVFTVGYHIVTVDGPKVTFDYYASPNGCNGDCNLSTDIIPYSFTKRESWGYSLNGKEMVVDQGQSFVMTDDTAKALANGETGYVGTQMAILNGTNGSTGKDFNLRLLAKTVDTGWAPATASTASDVLTLWGLHNSLATDGVPSGADVANYYYNLTSDKTDEYVLSMTFDATSVPGSKLESGLFGLATRNAEGKWINARSANYGNADDLFVQGPYQPGFALGTYGVDTSTSPATAWAVVNHQGDFAVADFAQGSPELYALISRKAGPASGRVWTLKLVNGPTEITNAKIDSMTLTQTGGVACAPVLGKPTTQPGIEVVTPGPRPEGNIAPAGSALNSVLVDFSSCAATARFNASINYSANGGALLGSQTFYNQFR